MMVRAVFRIAASTCGAGAALILAAGDIAHVVHDAAPGPLGQVGEGTPNSLASHSSFSVAPTLMCRASGWAGLTR